MYFAWAILLALGLVSGSAALAQTANCPGGPPDWKIDSRTGCKVWNLCPQHNETVTWSGACVDGIANGAGTSVWHRDGKQTESYEGSLRAGKSDGHGIMRLGNWSIEGDWRDGQVGGQVVLLTPNYRYEGGYNAGKPHGYGVLTRASGTVYKGNWTNGCLKIDAKGTMIALSATAAECGGTRR